MRRPGGEESAPRRPVRRRSRVGGVLTRGALLAVLLAACESGSGGGEGAPRAAGASADAAEAPAPDGEAPEPGRGDDAEPAPAAPAPEPEPDGALPTTADGAAPVVETDGAEPLPAPLDGAVTPPEEPDAAIAAPPPERDAAQPVPVDLVPADGSLRPPPPVEPGEPDAARPPVEEPPIEEPARDAARPPVEEPPPFEEPEADAGAPPVEPPEAPSRARRRMDLDQLNRAIRRVSDGIGWTEVRNNQEIDLFVELAATLGKADYLQITQENLQPSAIFQKFLGDAARSVCDRMVIRDLPLQPEARVLMRDLATDDVDPERVDANLARLVLRFHGQAVAADAPELDAWRWLHATALHVTDDPALAWRTVCVGLVTHPDFYMY